MKNYTTEIQKAKENKIKQGFDDIFEILENNLSIWVFLIVSFQVSIILTNFYAERSTKFNFLLSIFDNILYLIILFFVSFLMYLIKLNVISQYKILKKNFIVALIAIILNICAFVYFVNNLDIYQQLFTSMRDFYHSTDRILFFVPLGFVIIEFSIAILILIFHALNQNFKK